MNDSLHGMIRAHDLGDVCDKLIDSQLERLAWLEPKSQRREREPNKPLPVNNGDKA